MRCALCNGTIERYDPAFHHLKLDEQHEADICERCIDKFLKWQSGILAKLFPSKAMKRMRREK